MTRLVFRIGFWIERNNWFLYLTTIAIWSSILLSKLLFNGLVYGFDYGLFHPDGALYSFRALLWSGYSEFEAGKIVSDWYETNSLKAKYTGTDLYYSTNSMWDQYSSRLLYPLLSVPFVKLMGLPGMLVIPALTYLLVLLTTLKLAIDSKLKLLGLFLILLLTLSTTLSRWMFANTTDGLLLFFTSLLIISVRSSYNLNLRGSKFVLLISAVIGSSLTRFSLLTWLAVAIVFVIHKQLMKALCIALSSVLGILPIVLNPFLDSVLPGYGKKSLIEKLFIFPINLGKVTLFEIGQLFVLDRILLLLVLVSITLSLFNLRRLSSQMFLAILIAVWLTGAINGVLGVNFRYQLPVIPVMMWALIDLLPEARKIFNENLSERFSKSP